jgi:hypothetical protein
VPDAVRNSRARHVSPGRTAWRKPRSRLIGLSSIKSNELN